MDRDANIETLRVWQIKIDYFDSDFEAISRFDICECLDKSGTFLRELPVGGVEAAVKSRYTVLTDHILHAQFHHSVVVLHVVHQLGEVDLHITALQTIGSEFGCAVFVWGDFAEYFVSGEAGCNNWNPFFASERVTFF